MGTLVKEGNAQSRERQSKIRLPQNMNVVFSPFDISLIYSGICPMGPLIFREKRLQNTSAADFYICRTVTLSLDADIFKIMYVFN